jgi:hypothetical protein
MPDHTPGIVSIYPLAIINGPGLICTYLDPKTPDWVQPLPVHGTATKPADWSATSWT